MSHPADASPTRQQKARRTHRLRERGLTWEQIADVWEKDYFDINPRIAFRWAHNMSHQEVAERWNSLDVGEPTMTKSRIYEFEAWPHKGRRRPTSHNLNILARIYQTTARRLLADSEYALYPGSSRTEINKIDHRRQDENYRTEIHTDDESALSLVFGLVNSRTNSRGERLTVGGAEFLLRRLYRLDDEFGGNDLCAIIGGHVQSVSDLLKTQSLTPGESSRIRKVLGGLTQIGGWLSIDANRHADANRYLATSLYTAYEENDLRLASHVLGYMSLHALYRGRSREALSLGSTATALAGSRTDRIGAILHTRTARAHARVGESTPCMRQLDIAQTFMSNSTSVSEEPEWISYVDEIELAAQRGACFLDLGMQARPVAERARFGRQAADTLEIAIEGIETRASERTRDLVHYSIRLASAYALQDEPRKAVSVAEEAYTLARNIESARVSERFTELIPLLDGYDLPETRELIGRMEQ
jgi:hypothetical protein